MTTPAPQGSPASVAAPPGPLLEIRDLAVYFHVHEGVARAVDGVSLEIPRGKTLGLVGESGCGKSVTALSVLGLLPSPPARIGSGQILFDGEDLLAKDERAMQRIRGNRIGMIFQEPMTALNPVYTVGAQVAEVFRLHRGMGRREAWSEAVGMLERVRIPEAAARARDYPHQLSGGMRQRAMIAMALACRPALLIADEPTTALDVTVQAQILDLMAELQASTGASILMITHDLGVVAEIADRVSVMYAGRVVEEGPCREIFEQPGHPYTRGLMDSVPDLEALRERLAPITGNVPSPMAWPEGCRFHPRCPHARERCREETPVLENFRGADHRSRCFFAREIFN